MDAAASSTVYNEKNQGNSSGSENCQESDDNRSGSSSEYDEYSEDSQIGSINFGASDSELDSILQIIKEIGEGVMLGSSSESSSEDEDGDNQAGPSCSCMFRCDDMYYTPEDPLILEIRRRLEAYEDGIVLEGLSYQAHKLKVIYEVLKYYKIPAVIKTEEGYQDAETIEKRSPMIFTELMQCMGYYSKEAMISMRDLIHEDYEAIIAPAQLDELLAMWVDEAGPTESDIEEVEESFDAPIETNITVRKEKRRQRIVKDLSKTLGEMSKEDMLTMKSDVLEAYIVVISDADLRSLIEEWGKDMKLGGLGGEALFDVLRANGVITSQEILLQLTSKIKDLTKADLLGLKERYVGVLKEHHYVELFVTWSDNASPTDSDILQLWNDISMKELCNRLEWDVVDHVSRGLALSGRTVYKHSGYWWKLNSANIDQFFTQGWFKLCSAGINYATYCRMANCRKNTHPCYTITVHDGSYCVVDSEECAEGGIVYGNDRGEQGHSHSASVIHYWLSLYIDADRVYKYHSLLTNSREVIDAKIRDHIQTYSDTRVEIDLMINPLHED